MCGSATGACSWLRARAVTSGWFPSPAGSCRRWVTTCTTSVPTDRLFVVLKGARRGQPLSAEGLDEILAGARTRAGLEHATCHELRHTCLTRLQTGMRLEAIAALLGHRTMEMTLIYARIANRVVADEYAAVSAKIDALYGQPPALPADYETTGMARLRREAHARMLGNGLCTRPAELDCRMESACETCAYFRTGTQFLPILTRQRDHARDHGQADRAALFDGLIQRAGTGPATTERS